MKKDAVNVYGLIGEAEAKAHNKSIKEIHFHEVGTMDAIADDSWCVYVALTKSILTE